MISITTNADEALGITLDKIRAFKNNPAPIMQIVAMAVLPEMKKRVHIDGKDSNGGQIGTYSPGYMAVRTGNFKNSSRVTKGANKGKLKDAGVFTKKGVTFFTQEDEETVTGRRAFIKIEHEKKARPKHNRTADTKVILSLTRQLENDLSIVATGENSYGIGYLNQFNMQKAKWCEQTYKKPILSKLTNQEEELAGKVANETLPQYLKTLQ